MENNCGRARLETQKWLDFVKQLNENEKDTTKGQLEQRLSQLGRRKVPVDPDGNCQLKTRMHSWCAFAPPIMSL
jgi:hypothetical protein